MGDSFLEFMKSIGIFLVCAQSVVHFVGGKSYEKYVKLLIGFMLLAQFIVPVRTFFLGGEKGEIWNEVEHFQQEMEQVMAESKIMAAESQEDWRLQQVEQQLQEEMTERLGASAAEYGYEIESVRIMEEPSVICIVLSAGNKKGSIQINKISIGEQSEKTKKTDKMEPLKKAFADCLGVEESYVEIELE